MSSTAPEFMPVLSGGGHANPKEGACVMEYVSLLAGESWSDHPSCTHPVLASAARNINDRLPDDDRHLLVPLIGRLMGTAPTGTDHDRKVIAVRLAVWAARRVLVNIPDGTRREEAEAAIAAADGWCAGTTTQEQCRSTAASADASAYASAAAYAAAAYAAAASASAYASAAAYDASAYAAAASASAYAASAYAAAAYAADASAYASASAAYAAAGALSRRQRSELLVAFLSDLIDEHDRLTGRPAPVEVSTGDLKWLCTQVG